MTTRLFSRSTDSMNYNCTFNCMPITCVWILVLSILFKSLIIFTMGEWSCPVVYDWGQLFCLLGNVEVYCYFPPNWVEFCAPCDFCTVINIANISISNWYWTLTTLWLHGQRIFARIGYRIFLVLLYPCVLWFGKNETNEWAIVTNGMQ